MREYEEKAIERIRIAHEIAAGMNNALIVAYSGGKDAEGSVVVCERKRR